MWWWIAGIALRPHSGREIEINSSRDPDLVLLAGGDALRGAIGEHLRRLCV
jgi:hypothetical protein